MLSTEYKLVRKLRSIRRIHHRLMENRQKVLQSQMFSKGQKKVLSGIIRRLDHKAEILEQNVLRKINRHRKFLLENKVDDELDGTSVDAMASDVMPHISHLVPIGSIYYSSWGYDQTNVSFYQVVGHTGKQTVLLKRIGAKPKESGQGYQMLEPIKGKFIGDEVVKARIIKHKFNLANIKKNLDDGTLPDLKISGRNASYNYIFPYTDNGRGVYSSHWG